MNAIPLYQASATWVRFSFLSGLAVFVWLRTSLFSSNTNFCCEGQRPKTVTGTKEKKQEMKTCLCNLKLNGLKNIAADRDVLCWGSSAWGIILNEGWEGLSLLYRAFVFKDLWIGRSSRIFRRSSRIFKGLLRFFKDPQGSFRIFGRSLKILQSSLGSLKILERSSKDHLRSLKILLDLLKILKISVKVLEDPQICKRSSKDLYKIFKHLHKIMNDP